MNENITLLDYFAGQALQGLLSNVSWLKRVDDECYDKQSNIFEYVSGNHTLDSAINFIVVSLMAFEELLFESATEEIKIFRTSLGVLIEIS